MAEYGAKLRELRAGAHRRDREAVLAGQRAARLALFELAVAALAFAAARLGPVALTKLQDKGLIPFGGLPFPIYQGKHGPVGYLNKRGQLITFEQFRKENHLD